MKNILQLLLYYKEYMTSLSGANDCCSPQSSRTYSMTNYDIISLMLERLRHVSKDFDKLHSFSAGYLPVVERCC